MRLPWSRGRRGQSLVLVLKGVADVVDTITSNNYPRGRRQGGLYDLLFQIEDQFLMTKEDMFEQIVGLTCGRTTEKIDRFGVQSNDGH